MNTIQANSEAENKSESSLIRNKLKSSLAKLQQYEDEIQMRRNQGGYQDRYQ